MQLWPLRPMPSIQILIACLALTIAAGSGWQVRGWRCDATTSAMLADAHEGAKWAAEKARRTEQLQQQVTDITARAEALRNQERLTVTKYITQEKIKYVQTDAVIDCGLDAHGVRIHNIAASGRVPPATDTTTKFDDPPRGATAAEVVNVVTENYQTCRANADRLRSIQAWAVLMLKIN